MRDTFGLDESTVEALLGGAPWTAAASEHLAPVAALLRDARVGAATGILVGQPATVAAMRAAVVGSPVGVGRPRPDRMPGRTLSLKAAAITGMVVLGTGTAAAATGSLPAPAQSAAHTVLSIVGIRVPEVQSTVHATHARSGHGRLFNSAAPVTTTTVSSGDASDTDVTPATPQARRGAAEARDRSAPSSGGTSRGKAVRDHGASGTVRFAPSRRIERGPSRITGRSNPRKP